MTRMIDRRRMLRWSVGASVAALVTACGGGGGNEGVTVVPGGSPTPTPTPAPTPTPSSTPVPSPTPSPTGTIVVLSDSLGVPMIEPLAARTGRPVAGFAIGGQTSGQIANRALGVTLSLKDARLVAGANVVTMINRIAIGDAPNGNISHRILSGAGDTYSLRGVAGGVTGTLTRTTPAGVETYTFVPDDGAGLPRAFPNDTPFAPEIPAGPIVYLAGRNNFFLFTGHPEYGIDAVLADARRVIAAFPRVLVLAVSNGDLGVNEYGPDGGLYLQIAAINDGLARVAGNRFLDHVRIAKDRGLALAGIASDARSDEDRRHDVIPYQLRSDQLHGNAAGGDVFAQIVSAKLAELGW